MTEDPVVRPNPLQWLRYVYIGSVPRKNASWVLYDATCSTWVMRHIARFVVLIAPVIAAVMLFLPATLSIRVEGSASAGLAVLIGYMCFTTESLGRRVEKAGYPFDLAQQMREERGIASQRAVAARARERREFRGR